MTALFSIQEISVRFGGLLALDGFSMDVEQGSIHALIGPNGAGKSTVLNCVSRFCNPIRGQIEFDGQSILTKPADQIVNTGIARTFQNLELLRRMTVLETMLIGLTSRISNYVPFWPSGTRTKAERTAIEDAESILDQLGLLPYRDTFAGQLDFGHQKLLDLARALAAKPRLLLLDEPAAGLRNREISFVDRLLLDLSRQRGITIVLVEHVMRLVMSVADKITVLNFGRKIAEGTPSTIRSDRLVIEAYLGSAATA